MKTALLYIIHTITCVGIIGLVLVQKGKGASLGIAFGSGSSKGLLNSGQSSNNLVKITTLLAVIFFSTSFMIGYLNRDSTAPSLVESIERANELG